MACGKPPKPGSITPSQRPVQVLETQAWSIQRELSALLERREAQNSIDETVERAERAIDRLIETGGSKGEIKQLKHQLRQLESKARDQTAVELGQSVSAVQQTEPVLVGTTVSSISEETASRFAPDVAKALEDEGHWRSEQYKEKLIDIVEANEKIPQQYKEQLPEDVATILRTAPKAAGLIQELTHRGQVRATGDKSKLGNRGNAGIGTAYELMGTAALIRKPSDASNHAPILSISSSTDKISFGEKSFINSQLGKNDEIEKPTRSTIESDLKIIRKTSMGIREIGVDFKHKVNMGTVNRTEDFKNQVDNVIRAIQHGDIHEYHFVTNGSFSGPYKAYIDQANETLAENNNEIIGYHEHVSSLPASD